MAFLPDEEGPRLVEIVLVIVLVAIIVITMIAVLEPVISGFLDWMAGAA